MADQERTPAVFRDVISQDVLKAVLPIHFPGAKRVADLTWGEGRVLELGARIGCSRYGYRSSV